MSTGAVGRPGVGGRQPFASPHTATSATRDLHEQFGAPMVASSQGVTMLSWLVDESGDGIVFARLSGRDLQRGETALLQIHPAREMMGTLGLAPRLLVVTTDNTGARDYERRPDFAAVEQARDQGWLRWVCWRDQDRIAREPVPFELFMRMLLSSEIDLYLLSLGRRVDWAIDRLLLRTLGTVSAEEREKITERTHRALRERWLKEGRGWPSAKRFGFRRNPVTKFLEVDPEQWEFVKRIHLRYAELEQSSAGRGAVALAGEMASLGCEFAPRQILRMLADRIYVDGTWSINDGEYEGRTIALTDPIPERVFQRNQELLAVRRGRSSRTHVGEFALSGVLMVHAACADQRNDAGRRSTLLGRREARPGLCYRHAPWVPTQCRGFSIPRDELDDAVADALVALTASPEIRAAWRGAVAPLAQTVPAILRENDAQALDIHIARMCRQLGRVRRMHRETLAQGATPDARTYRDLTEDLAAEIERSEARRRARQTDLHLPPRSNPDHDDLHAAMRLVLFGERDGDPALARSALIAHLVDIVTVVDGDDGDVHVEIQSPFADPARDVSGSISR